MNDGQVDTGGELLEQGEQLEHGEQLIWPEHTGRHSVNDGQTDTGGEQLEHREQLVELFSHLNLAWAHKHTLSE